MLCSPSFPAVAITGARQAGKTALVRHVFPDINYVSMDFPALAAQAEHNPADFFRERGVPLIIDEVQYAPSLSRYLKTMIDADRRPGRLILTGSQVFPFMQGVSESLAGRCGILTVMNLAAAELRSFSFQGGGIFKETEFLFSGSGLCIGSERLEGLRRRLWWGKPACAPYHFTALKSRCPPRFGFPGIIPNYLTYRFQFGTCRS